MNPVSRRPDPGAAPEGSDEITLLDSLILPEGARAVWLTLEVTQPQATARSEAEHRVAGNSFPCPPAGAAGAHRVCRRSGSYRQR
nr:Uncharacterised protein [Klebsiella pneumoniae]